VDGHDIPPLEHALRLARGFDGPVIVHCATRKGFGYAPAENDEADQMPSKSATKRPRRCSARLGRSESKDQARALRIQMLRRRRGGDLIMSGVLSLHAIQLILLTLSGYFLRSAQKRAKCPLAHYT
jgi:hypothetical protein